MIAIPPSFKIVPKYEALKENLRLATKPKSHNLPLRLMDAPEDIDQCEDLPVEDQGLAEWVSLAVQEVGWAARDVYNYLRKPNPGDIKGVFHFTLT